MCTPLVMARAPSVARARTATISAPRIRWGHRQRTRPRSATGESMPELTFSQALTANQIAFRPLQFWRYRRLPYRAQVTVLLRGTTVGAKFTVLAGTTEI